jgi:hypothetical protein
MRPLDPNPDVNGQEASPSALDERPTPNGGTGSTVGTGSALGIGCVIAVVVLVLLAIALRWLTGVW